MITLCLMMILNYWEIPKCREIYEEQASEKHTARPQLEGCLKSLREGDILVVWRLDRLGRNLADLENRKINFESLTEKIETVHRLAVSYSTSLRRWPGLNAI
jgi:DNA invertase Pin-like site-specific DNA recombinase